MAVFIWEPIVATVAILLCSLIACGLWCIGRRVVKQKSTPEKNKTYACGEELKAGEMHADSEQFFSPIRRVFRPFYRYIQAAHTGVLSTYLLWAIVGLVILLVIILLTVR
jgi:peptide subunit release factor 1 (eRF1)